MSPATGRSTAKTIEPPSSAWPAPKAATSASDHALLKRMLPSGSTAAWSLGARSTCSTGRQPCDAPGAETAEKLAPTSPALLSTPKAGGGCRMILRSSIGGDSASAPWARHCDSACAKYSTYRRCDGIVTPVLRAVAKASRASRAVPWMPAYSM